MSHIIAITGYPGAGKTSLAKALAKLGYRVLFDLFQGEISIKELKRRIILGSLPVFIPGFWSHLLGTVTKVLFIKAPFHHYEKIYKQRGYGLKKTLDNLEALKLGHIEKEIKALKGVEVHILENTLKLNFNQLAEKAIELLSLNTRK